MTPTTAEISLPLVPPDVEKFAAEVGVSEYLGPVMEMTRRVFSSARRIAVFTEEDAEIAGLWAIVIEVRVTEGNVDRLVEQHRRWTADLFHYCPSTHVCWFCLSVDVEAP
jgi:hypothetical protein